MQNVGFIIEQNSVNFFKLLGATVKFASTSDEANAALKEMVNSNYAIIYLTKKVKTLVSETFFAKQQMNENLIITTLPF